MRLATNQGRVAGLAVAGDHQGQGVGTVLITQLEATAAPDRKHGGGLHSMPQT